MGSREFSEWMAFDRLRVEETEAQRMAARAEAGATARRNRMKQPR